jgi:hypothetical protein
MARCRASIQLCDRRENRAVVVGQFAVSGLCEPALDFGGGDRSSRPAQLQARENEQAGQTFGAKLLRPNGFSNAVSELCAQSDRRGIAVRARPRAGSYLPVTNQPAVHVHDIGLALSLVGRVSGACTLHQRLGNSSF